MIAALSRLPALEAEGQRWTPETVDALAEALAQRLRGRGLAVLASQLDNGLAWVLADRAAERAGLAHLPLPAWFTPAQRAHALARAGAGLLLTAPAPGAETWALAGGPSLGAWPLQPAAPGALPAGTGLITFTSGTTGTPKGVALSRARLGRVAQGLATATAALPLARHLAVLPLAVLLEQVAGLMAPACRGGTVILKPLAALGWRGSSSFDPAALQAVVEAEAPHSLILLPQMLRGWTAWLAASGRRAPASLRLVAVGGAAVGARSLAAARAVGLPAYEGYGLSEAGSVQALNLPGDDAPGRAGRPLPHARVRVAADGEVWLGGTPMLGYLGEPGGPAPAPLPEEAEWPSGDVGSLDAEGRLVLQGRRSQLLITAYGRNVAPEWVEAALHDAVAPGTLAQAVVLGDGEPALSAVLWPGPALAGQPPAAQDAALAAAVATANAGLPDYAQVARWTRGLAPFDAARGLATDNGRPRRAAIATLHADALGLAPAAACATA